MPFRSSHSGGESPIYAVPFQFSQPIPFLNKDFQYNSRLQNISEINSQKEVVYASRNEKGKLSNLLGGSLHRNKHHHRRVRSISDIDSVQVDAL